MAAWSLRNRVTVWVLTLCMTVGGMFANNHLGRLEDPAFTIKTAQVMCSYPGAEERVVEEEVTEVLENAVQQLSGLWRVRSTSNRGLAVLTVDIQKTVPAAQIPQMWDELRRKINDASGQLPPGAGSPQVIDDFGDVYGVFLALVGPEYTPAELRQTARDLQRRLVVVPEVAKVSFFGDEREAVIVDFDTVRMTELGINREAILAKLRNENLVVDAGTALAGSERVALRPTALIHRVEDLERIVISVQDGAQFRIRDVAQIRRGYPEPPSALMRSGGLPAVGLGISTVLGGNVVRMGEAVMQRVQELTYNEGLMGTSINRHFLEKAANSVR